uniref:Endonuclease/exonuclease/phosphatase domain-containing protein n=1 Tax=Arion vulgaris TaxID=1028688 RepID=A0A0B6Z4S6_9EUPU
MASRPEDEDSVMDLTLVSQPLATACKWSVCGDPGSDHSPCIIFVEKGKS